MAIATCIECDEEIEINSRPRLTQKVICPNCGAALEVVSLNPLEVDWAYEDDDDDWDDDELGDDVEDDEELEFDDDDFEDEEDDVVYDDNDL